jgi:hypothetical protein
MSVDALCIKCRKPLGADGICPHCDAEEAEIAAKLRWLREEIAREKGGTPPAEPKSKLWRSKKAKLEEAKEAERERGGEAASEPAADVAGDDEASRTEAAGADPAQGAPAAAGAVPAAAPPTEPPAPSRVLTGVSASGIRARELDVTDPRHGSDAVRELLEHRGRGLGKIIGIAGLPRHGKTKLADRLRERYAERPGADLRYDKTERGEVNLYYVPGRREHHVLIDVAGEDFQALGDYERDIPALMRQFLWPVLQQLDGLILLMALPIVWAGWNDADSDRRADPAERDEIGMREARERMVNAHRMLLKYALVAQDLGRLRKALPSVALSPDEVPTRNQVDDAVPTARKLRVPVAIGFSKADLYVPGTSVASGRRGDAPERGRPGLFTPDLPGRSGQPAPPLHPARTDPLMLGHLHFPELFGFLEERVSYFKFDFVQALVDRSRDPNPQEAREADADAGRGTLLGGEALVEFVTQHPWGLPGLDTAFALRVDRWLRRERWERDLLRALYETGEGT